MKKCMFILEAKQLDKFLFDIDHTHTLIYGS